VTALTIAVGIGANTTVFSVVNSVLLKPPPGIQNASELVRPHRIAEDGSSYHDWSYPSFLQYKQAESGLADLAAFALTAVGVESDGVPETTNAFFVSHNFCRLVGVRPSLGRLFLLEEDAADHGNLVAVLSHSLWRHRFASDSSIVGGTVRLNQRTVTIVGVTQEGFLGPHAMLDAGVWLPVGAAPAFNDAYDLTSLDVTWLDAIGRLVAGNSIEQVERALNVVSGNLRSAYPATSKDYGVMVEPYGPLGREEFWAAAAFSAFMFVASGMILLIACANVGAMLVLRAVRRGKEMALRLALGASRGRVVRQLLTESAMLFCLGGGGGLLLAHFTTKLLSSYQLPFEVPLIFDFAPDVRALLFSLFLALSTGLVFGLTPALQVTRPDLNTTLKGDRPGSGFSSSRLRNALVVSQVAGSAVLLISAGLFARGLARAEDIDVGFEPAGLHALSIRSGLQGTYTNADAVRLFALIVERASALPQVESAGLIDYPPVTMGGQSTPYVVVGREPAVETDRTSTDFARVSPGLLETMKIGLLRGQTFSEADREDAPMVAIVNETFARREWPEEEALGKRIQLDLVDESALEVVGVARNAKYRSLSEEPRSMVYVPYAQSPTTDLVLVVRVRPGSENIGSKLRELLHDLEPRLLTDANSSYESFMGIALLPSRAAALMTSVLGMIGLALASLGLYGILTYSVIQRRREIGIRMSVGADQYSVSLMVLLQCAKLAGVGLVTGFLVALAVTRLFRSLLHGLSPTDPITFVAIALILITVAIAASYLPVRRATRTNPIEALNDDSG
jgi:predicted permease